MSKKTLGETIKSLRTKAGIGVRELGRMTGVTGTHISNIEKNKATPSPDLLSKIAKITEADIDRLFLKANMIDPELIEIIQKNISVVPDFLRTAKNIKKKQWGILKKRAESMRAIARAEKFLTEKTERK